MTEPDEALLWARDAVVRFWSKTDPEFCREVQAGFWDDSDRVKWRVQAYRAGAAASEARIKALEEALSDLLSLCENAAAGAFRNGVTDTSNTIDEGEVIAWRFMDNARALLKEADQ